MKPDLDAWLPDAALRVSHARASAVAPQHLWRAARAVRLSDTRLLGRLVRWRIPGTPRDLAYDELFRSPPFTVLDEDDTSLVSGLVGRIWTLRRDYPELVDSDGFRGWSEPGTVRVLFANWVAPRESGSAELGIEARVAPTDREGRIGLASVRPIVAASQGLIASEGLEAALRLLARDSG